MNERRRKVVASALYTRRRNLVGIAFSLKVRFQFVDADFTSESTLSSRLAVVD